MLQKHEEEIQNLIKNSKNIEDKHVENWKENS